MDCRNASGMTLIELMVSLLVVLILVTLAIPEFISILRNTLLGTQTRSFVSAVHFSRTHALTRNAKVVMCTSSSAACSVSGKWEEGWLTFADDNGNGKAEAGEVIRVFDGLKEGYLLRSNIKQESSLIFYPDGSVRKGSGGLPLMTFSLCAPDASSATIKERSREIVINVTGRMRVQFGRPGITKCPGA